MKRLLHTQTLRTAKLKVISQHSVPPPMMLLDDYLYVLIPTVSRSPSSELSASTRSSEAILDLRVAI